MTPAAPSAGSSTGAYSLADEGETAGSMEAEMDAKKDLSPGELFEAGFSDYFEIFVIGCQMVCGLWIWSVWTWRLRSSTSFRGQK